jgi:hypothetical protein
MHTNLVVFLSVIVACDTLSLLASKTAKERFLIFPIYLWVVFTLLATIGVIK